MSKLHRFLAFALVLFSAVLGRAATTDLAGNAIQAAGLTPSSTWETYILQVAPTVTTASATNLASASVTLGGEVTATGGASVTERGIVYGTTNPPTTSDNKVAIGSGAGTFSQSVTGLAASTTYYVRAFATNSVGTSYGSVVTIATLAPAPVITSGATASGTYGSSTFSYTIAASNSPTGFSSTTLPPGLILNTSTGAITGTPTDTSGSPYSVTISATNASGTGNATLTITINKRSAVVLVASQYSAATKVYDGTTAVLNLTKPGTVAFTGKFGSDDVSVDQTNAVGTFASKDAGSRAATISGLMLTGAAASNYSLSVVGTTSAVAITKKSLTITGLAGASRTYDGTTVATLSGTAALQPAISAGSGISSDGQPYDGDSITLTGTPTATFDSKNVGTSKPITVTGYSLTGTGAGNYDLTQPTGLTGTVTAKALTVNGLTAEDKIYNGTSAATLTGTAALLAAETAGAGAADDGKPYTGDVVSLGGTAVGTFASSGPGTGIAVTVTGLSASGTDAGNYSITQPTGLTATILPPVPTVTSPTSASIASTSVTLGGNVTDDGGVSITERGIVYAATATNSNPQLNGTGVTKIVASGTSTGVFTAPVTGLSFGTGYSYAAYAVNSTGAGYSNVDTFTTVTPVLAFIGTSTALTANPNSSAVDVCDLLHVTDEVSGRTITWSQHTAPAHGTLAFASATASSGATDIAPGGTITYTPTAGNTTTDTFVVQAANGTTTVTRTITVTFRGQGTAGAGFVAVGEAGTILTSPDGSTWTARTSGTAARLRGVTASANLFVAVGEGGSVLTSPDGTGWTARTSGVTETLRGVAASPTRFVAVGGDSGTLVRTSADGVNWSAANPPAVGKLRGVAWGGGRFVAVGAAGAVVTSPDGITWTQQNAGTTERLDGIVWTGTQFSAVSSTGKIYSSVDGTSWTSAQALPPSWLEALAWSDTAFVTVGSGGKIKTTTNAESWAFRTSGTTHTLHGVTWSGVFVDQATDAVAAVANMRKITVAGVTAPGKTYDGNATAALNTSGAALSGVASGDIVTLDTSAAAGAFSDRHIGAAKTVTVTGFAISGANADDYTLVQPAGLTADITAKALTVTGVTASNKTYDGNADATLNTSHAALVGVVGGESVSLSSTGATGAFDNKNAGANKPVTLAGFSIGSTGDAANYTLTQPGTTATITAKALTVTGVTASDKIYDRTTTATLNTASAALIGVIGGDSVMLGVGSATGMFDTKNVGTNKTVTVAGLSIGSTGDAANYTLTQPTTTANITAKALTVSGVTANNKTYDGNTGATLDTSTAALVGVVSGDMVSLGGSATGAFDTKNVGTNKTVTIAGLSIGGTGDAANYSLTPPTASANITAKPLTVSGVTADNKTYDGNTHASLVTTNAALVGVLSGEQVTLSTSSAAGAFDTRTVGTNKTVTITGLSIGSTGDAANYSLTQPSATANITAKSLAVTGVTGVNRTYNANAVATLDTSAAALSGVVNGDAVTLNKSGAAATFADKNVGANKPVTTTGFAIEGADAGNYALTQPDTTADISKKALTINGVSASNKVYDATIAATLSGTPALGTATAVGGSTVDGNPYAGDVVSITGTMSGTFADRHAESSKIVTVAGLVLEGADAGNYLISALTSSANITPKPLTIAGVSALDRVYDGTAVAPLTGSPTLATAQAAGSGTTSDGAPYAGDVVTIDGAASGAFADRHVAANKAVTVTGLTLAGAQAANYTPTQPAGLTANVTAKTLTVVGLGATARIYDGTTVAPLTGTPALQAAQAAGAGSSSDGARYDNDDVSLSGTAAGAFADRHAASEKAITVSGLGLAGAQADNYVLQPPTTLTADVTPKTLTSSGLATVARIYDGTTVAPLTGTAVLGAAQAAGAGTTTDGLPYTGDALAITGTPAGALADRHVGTGKTVTISGLVLSGAQNANYALTMPTGLTGAVTPKALQVQGLAGATKVYDATTSGPLSGTAALLATQAPGTGTTADGKPYSGDTVALGGTAAATFADKLVGVSKPLTVTGLTLTGAHATNYSIVQPASLTATITRKELTVSGVAVMPKNFNNSTAALLNFSVAALVGIAGSDTVTLVTDGATGTFASAGAASSISVTVAGLTLGGADAANYTLIQPSATGTILKAGATVTLGSLAQTYDGTPRVVTATTTPSVALVAFSYNGSSVAPTNAGSYSVSATVNDANYEGSASGTLIVGKASQTVTIAAPGGTLTAGTAFGLSASASSGLPVTFSIVSGNGSLSGSSLTLAGTTPVVVRATQAGDGNYEPATAERTFTATAAAKQPQTIAFDPISNKKTNDGPFGLSAVASSGLPVTFSIVSGPALVSGSTATLTGASGAVIVRASQAGNASFDPAPDVTQSFNVIGADAHQVFFGVTQNNDTVAIDLAPDGTSGTLLCYIGATGEAFIVIFTINPDGTFDATVVSLGGNSVVASTDGSAPGRAAATPPRTFRGKLSGNTITGSIVELGLSFSTTLQPRTGPTAAISGLYQSSSLNSAGGRTASIVGTEGQVIVVATTATISTGGTGAVATDGTFMVQAVGATIAGAVDAPTTTVSGSILVPNQPAVPFSGIASTTVRTDRLINLSSRARIGPAAGRTLITGFVIGGSDTKRVLLRAVGPALTGFGVSGAIPNPRLQLYNGQGALVLENDDWAGADTAAAFNQVGAFALGNGARDAALLTTLAPGAYTMHVIDGGDTGVALAEIYDASPNPQGEYQRLINISSRGTVEAGDGVLIGGFVVTGNAPKKVLVRGVGPALAGFGLTGTLADPRLAIYSGSTVIAANNDWGAPTPISSTQIVATAAEIAEAARVTGAFAFGANSRDAAVVITLAPGAYTAQVSAVDGSTGVALVEIYEIPE